jgi:hyperosmotically inducible protein
VRALVAAAVAAVALLAGCATVDPLEDTRIEAEVKARLVAQTNANLTRLGVISSRGRVFLNGTVGSDEERSRAEALTREVRGVRTVVNQVGVRARPPE